MADLSNKLNEILSDPEMMEQIKGLSSMLGMSGESTKDEEVPAREPEPVASPQMAINDDTMKMIMKFMPLINSVNKDDENTNLLRALRPMLGKERQKKVDEAIKILQMMKFIPILKSQGIF